MPIESPFVFYPRYAAGIARKAVVLAKRWYDLKRIVRKIEADPNAKSYRDEAMTPVAEEDSEHMELYTQNEAARAAVEREHRVAGHHGAPHGGNGHQSNGHGNGHAAVDHDHHTHDEPRPAPPII
jgi:hypothetical protein